METTTIQIRKALKNKLEGLKVYPNETMDQLIERLADNKIDHEPLSADDIKGIEKGLADIKAGKVYTTKKLKKDLGIKELQEKNTIRASIYRMTKESHDQLAMIWVNQPSYFDASLKHLHVKRFLKYCKKGSLVLDAGCGLGKEAKLLISEGLKVISIDISTGMLKQARKLVPEGDFRFMDMKRLKFPDNKFDGVWCFSSIHHIRKNEADVVLKEFSRVLKDGGALMISSKHGKGWYYNVTINKGRKLKRFITNYSRGELNGLLSRNGFKAIGIWVDRSKQRKDWERVVVMARKIT